MLPIREIATSRLLFYLVVITPVRGRFAAQECWRKRNESGIKCIFEGCLHTKHEANRIRLVCMNGNGTAYPPGPSNSGGAGESPASPAFRTNSGRKDVKPTRESRATMACAACRKQKMKCEGGEPGTVCRRCRVQNLECLFEAPAGNLGGRSRNDFSDRSVRSFSCRVRRN